MVTWLLRTVSTWHECQVDGPFGDQALGSEAPDGFQVLDRHTFHVLGATSIDAALPIFESLKRIILPLVRINRDHISVGVEEDGGKSWVRSSPSGHKDGLVGYRGDDLVLQADLLNNLLKELNS